MGMQRDEVSPGDGEKKCPRQVESANEQNASYWKNSVGNHAIRSNCLHGLTVALSLPFSLASSFVGSHDSQSIFPWQVLLLQGKVVVKCQVPSRFTARFR